MQHVETLEKRARVLGRDMEPKEHHEQVVNASADQVRAHRVLIKEAIEENRQIMIEELRQRVDSQREGFANWDGRMDELEEAEAEAKRLEHAIDKQGRRRAKERSKIQMAKKNREMVLAVQEDDRMHEAMSMSYRTNAMRAEGRRIKALYNKEEKKINEAEHLRMAADAKASVLATKENAQRVKQENVNSAFQRVAHHRRTTPRSSRRRRRAPTRRTATSGTPSTRTATSRATRRPSLTARPSRSSTTRATTMCGRSSTR